MPSPWGRWRGAVPWHCTVTDEGSPLTAGLTSARTLANSVHGAAAPSAPSEGFGFRAPPVAETARRQAAAVRKCKANAAARAANGEGAKLAFAFASGKSKRRKERIHDQLTLWHPIYKKCDRTSVTPKLCTQRVQNITHAVRRGHNRREAAI